MEIASTVKSRTIEKLISITMAVKFVHRFNKNRQSLFSLTKNTCCINEISPFRLSNLNPTIYSNININKKNSSRWNDHPSYWIQYLEDITTSIIDRIDTQRLLFAQTSSFHPAVLRVYVCILSPKIFIRPNPFLCIPPTPPGNYYRDSGFAQISLLSLFSFSVSLSFRGGSFGGIGWIKGGKQCCGRHRFAAAVLTTHFRASSFRGMYFLRRYLQLLRAASPAPRFRNRFRPLDEEGGCLIAFLTLLILCVICCCGTNTFFFSKNKYVSLIRVDVVIFWIY